jgi:hypothetical protein
MRPFHLLLLLVVLCLTAQAPAHAEETDCEMRFQLKGWSAFYKTAKGSGTIRCNNGQTMRVILTAKGGGLTFGKSSITDGKGEFSGIDNISEVLGTYVASEAHAGAAKSAKASAMTKGNVSLALAGKGKGWDVGIAFGKFVITRAD